MAGDDRRSEHLLKDLLKSIIRRTPYRVIRAGDANRFSAIEECLQSLLAETAWE